MTNNKNDVSDRVGLNMYDEKGNKKKIILIPYIRNANDKQKHIKTEKIEINLP